MKLLGYILHHKSFFFKDSKFNILFKLQEQTMAYSKNKPTLPVKSRYIGSALDVILPKRRFTTNAD
jgi:hypothetical protein